MRIYQLRCAKLYKYGVREIERKFLSRRTAERYARIFRLISPKGAAGIFDIDISAFGADIYVLTEDNHGEIGYFLDRDEAYEAARDVVMENPYLETWNGHGYDSREVTRDEITDQQIDDYDFLVGVKRYRLNNAWCH